MQGEIDQIKRDIQSIKQRNKRVETDKAWETSTSRIVIVAMMTYVVVAIVLFTIGDSFALRNGLIATIAFVLSIQSLPFLKRAWIKNYLRNKK